MRRLVLLSCAAVLVGCSKQESQPAADTTAAVAAAPAPMLMMTDLVGKWHFSIMPETSDSVLAEYDLTATADPSGWVLMLPGRPAMTPTVMVSGDSVVTESGPYESILHKGVQVTTHGVLRMQGGELVGMTTAHYATKSGDSTVMLRTKGSKVP